MLKIELLISIKLRNFSSWNVTSNLMKQVLFDNFSNIYEKIYCSGEKAMSFDRFVAVAVKYQIFSKQKQMIFHDGISQEVT